MTGLQLGILVAVMVNVLAVLVFLVYIFKKMGSDAKIKAAHKEAEIILSQAEKEAEVRKKNALLEAKDKNLEEKSKFERECNERMSKIASLDRRAADKESTMTRKLEQVDKRDKELHEREREIGKKEQRISEKEQRLTVTYEEQKAKLQQISGMTADQAKKELLVALESELKTETRHAYPEYGK